MVHYETALRSYTPTAAARAQRGRQKLPSPAQQRPPESAPAGVQGFIVALPTTWTAGENNISGMNLTLLAKREAEQAETMDVAANTTTHAGSNA